MMTGARKLFATVFKAVCLLIVVFARHSVAGEYTRQFFAVSGSIIMVALCNRADHYILPCSFFLSSFLFSSPNLSGRRVDVYHTLTHGVALVRI